MADLIDTTVEYVRSILDYDPQSGIFTWREREGDDQWNCRFGGYRAGSVTLRGYRNIVIAGRKVREHRLAWFYVHGVWPEGQIDHINRNKSDNRLINLRVVDNSENMLNLPPRKLNPKTLGVSYHRRDKRYVATLRLNNKPMTVGRFKTFEEARASRIAAEIKYFGEPAPIDLRKLR